MKGSPYVGEILDSTFRKAVVIAEMMSPDDGVRLKKQFHKPDDSSHEKQLAGHARPNVLFEAGMAFGKTPDSTVLVQVGSIRPLSDIGSRHVVRLSDEVQGRQELITKFSNAGRDVDVSGNDWLTEGNSSS